MAVQGTTWRASLDCFFWTSSMIAICLQYCSPSHDRLLELFRMSDASTLLYVSVQSVLLDHLLPLRTLSRKGALLRACLRTSSQSPAHIDQRTGGTDMRQCPWQSNVAQIRRIVHKQLRNDVETKQIYNLRIVGRKNLRQSCGKRKA